MVCVKPSQCGFKLTTSGVFTDTGSCGCNGTRVKKTPLVEFANIRRTGIISIALKKGDKYIPNILSPKQYKELENELNRKDVSVFADNPILSQKLSFIYIYYQ